MDTSGELLLNLATNLDRSSGPAQSRTAQRKQGWAKRRETKKAQRKGGPQGARPDPRSPSANGAPWLQTRHAGGGGGGWEQPAAAAPSQLKGYSLELPAMEAAAPMAAENRQLERQAAPASAAPAPAARPTARATGRQPQREDARPQKQQRTDSSGFEEVPRQQQQQLQPPPPPQQQQQQVAPAQERPAPKQQQQQQQPGGGGGAPAPGPRKRRGRGEDASPQRGVGRLRLMSRKEGLREATPDQDDMVAAGSDAEPEDVFVAVAAALTRDRALEAELAAKHDARYGSGSDDGDGDGGGGGARLGGTAAKRGRQQKQQQQQQQQQQEAARGAAAAAYSSGDNGKDGAGGSGSGGEGAVVDFGGYTGEANNYPRQPRLLPQAAGDAPKKRRKEKKKAVGSGKISVRPGELVHTVPSVAGAAQPPELFGEAPDSFRGLGLSPALSDHLAASNFNAPTRVQAQAIPAILAGRDALVNAPTGSGKTLAYLAPIVDALAARSPRVSRGEGTYAAVVTPTRELAIQVADVLAALLRRFVWLVGGAVHGGENRSKEKARLRRGVTVLVATPGRLLDHLQNSEAFRTEELRWLVLDEADRLLDLGFMAKIEEIVGLLDERATAVDGAPAHPRQTILLSATLHANLGALAGLSLRSPATIGFKARMEDGVMVLEAVDPPAATDAKHAKHAKQQQQQRPGLGLGPDFGGGPGPRGAAAAAEGGAALERFEIPSRLAQRFLEVPCKLRLVVLAALLRARVAAAPVRAKVVVFMSNCDSVEFYHAAFTRSWEAATGEALLAPHAAVPVLKLHGNMAQGERTAAFLAYAAAPAGVLLCTDVAARGLDFPAVTSIVQFDPPGEAAEYVHRVGRTARGGAAGDAALFLLPAERGYVAHLARHGVRLSEEAAGPILNRVLGRDAKAGKALPLERHHGAFALQRQLMEAVAGDKALAALGGDAFRSYIRAYATHGAGVKDIFHVKRLHLGHVAHSFALLERPTLVGHSSSKAAAKKRKAEAASGKKGGRHERTELRRQRQAAAGAGGSAKAEKVRPVKSAYVLM